MSFKATIWLNRSFCYQICCLRPLSVATPFLLFPDGLEITSISIAEQEVHVHVTSNRLSSPCPLCSTPSSAIHSYSRRKPLELPCVGKTVRLLLSVKKFFCRQEACPRKIFTERLPELIEPSSRLTTRLRSIVQAICVAFIPANGRTSLAPFLPRSPVPTVPQTAEPTFNCAPETPSSVS